MNLDSLSIREERDRLPLWDVDVQKNGRCTNIKIIARNVRRELARELGFSDRVFLRIDGESALVVFRGRAYTVAKITGRCGTVYVTGPNVRIESCSSNITLLRNGKLAQVRDGRLEMLNGNPALRKRS